MEWDGTRVLAIGEVNSTSLQNNVEFSHRDPAKIICVYTNASERFWEPERSSRITKARRETKPPTISIS